MKPFLLSILITTIFSGCKSTTQSSDHLNPLVQKFKPFLHGNWVNAEYIEDIQKTKSPLKSADKLRFISEFSIDSTMLKDDSAEIGAGYGNHEGGSFIIYFKQGKNQSSLITNIRDCDSVADKYELGYSVVGSDTILEINHFDKNEELVKVIRYLRSPKPIMDNDIDGIQYLVNEKLISGNYTSIDSVNTTTEIRFTNDGKILGLPGFTNFFILTDFVASADNITDEICFEIPTKKQKCYGFKIIADTIALFEPAKDELDTSYTPGSIKYKLIKKK